MQVVPRPSRPPTPSVIPHDSTPVGKQDKRDGRVLFLCDLPGVFLNPIPPHFIILVFFTILSK